MKYSIQNDKIVLHQVGSSYEALSASGVYKWSRRDQTMSAPVTIQALEVLSGAVGGLPEKLVAVLRKLKRRERMLQEQRELLTGDPAPLAHYPVKAKLMRHQIVGANMAMITFGMCDPETHCKG